MSTRGAGSNGNGRHGYMPATVRDWKAPDKTLRHRYRRLTALLLSLSTTSLAQSFTEYLIPTPDSRPFSVTSGPDGALWFTEWVGNRIGRITTDGIITEYRLPNADSQPIWIKLGPDGALWFTEQAGNRIGRITTSGAIVEYSLPTLNSLPWNIGVGPDGALWFTEKGSLKIGHITTVGVLTEYPVPLAPWDLTAGPDGALWITLRSYDRDRAHDHFRTAHRRVPTSDGQQRPGCNCRWAEP